MSNQRASAEEAPPCRLYLITPQRFDDLERFAGELEAALGAGDVAAVQLRLKGASDEDVLCAAARLTPVARARDVAFLINDRPDLAKAAGADGVHIGQSDASYAAARNILGTDAIIGVTCHASRDLAFAAGEAGADYVAFGAFFPTQTKETTARPTPEILKAWSFATTVPCVAIGGITPENCAPLVAAGADFLAVSSAVWDAPDGPADAVRRFGAAMGRAR